MGTGHTFCFSILLLTLVTAFHLYVFPFVQGRSLTSESSCPGRGFYRDKEDCSKFYRCVETSLDSNAPGDLAKYEFACPSGTLFDDKLYVCNYPNRITHKPGDCDATFPTYVTQGGHPYLTWYFHHPVYVHFLPVIHQPNDYLKTANNWPLIPYFD